MRRMKAWWVPMVACVAGLIGPARGAEGPVSPFGNRYDGLKLVFAELALPRGGAGGAGRLSLQPAESLRQAAPGEAASWLIVAIGDADPAARLGELGIDLERFLEQGGAALLATDGTTGPLFGRGDLHVRAAVVEVENGYFGRPACIPAREFDSADPLFDGTGELIVNRPGIIEGADGDIVARLPAGTSVDGAPQAAGPGVIAAGTVGRGRFVLIADQSLFANEMLLEGGNLAFARNVARWLGEPVGRRRTRVLFLVNGVAATEWFEDDFLSGDFTRTLTLPELFAVGNELLAGIQKEGIPNALATGAQGRLDPIAVRRASLLLPVGALGGYFAWRLARARERRRERGPRRGQWPGPLVGGDLPSVRSAGGSE